MKYIKRFNESTDNLFKRLETDEFDEFLNSHTMLDVNEKDEDFFNKFHRKGGRITTWRESKTFSFFDIGQTAIIKFDDDWWVVYLNVNNMFLCDQKEGVEEFLNSKFFKDKI